MIWNYQNNFASFRFQIEHGLGADTWRPYWTYSYFFGELFALFPVTAWLALKSRAQKENRLFLYLGWGPLLFFLISSVKGHVELNWPIIAFPSIFVLAALGAKSVKPIFCINIIWAILISVVTAHLIHPFLPNMPSKLDEPRYYKPVLEAVQKYQPVFASTYQMSSFVWYTTKKPFYKLFEMSRKDFYDSLPGSKPQAKTIYVIQEIGSELPDWIKPKQYKTHSTEKLGETFEVLEVQQRESLL